MDIKLPILWSAFGCVKTYDERYIIFIGGQIGDYITGPCNDVLYYDTVEGQIHKSKLRAPGYRGKCTAVIKDDPYENRLVYYGFVRGLKLETQIPHCLIECISEWYCNQQVWIFLVDSFGDRCSGWKINVDAILCSE